MMMYLKRYLREPSTASRECGWQCLCMHVRPCFAHIHDSRGAKANTGSRKFREDSRIRHAEEPLAATPPVTDLLQVLPAPVAGNTYGSVSFSLETVRVMGNGSLWLICLIGITSTWHQFQSWVQALKRQVNTESHSRSLARSSLTLATNVHVKYTVWYTKAATIWLCRRSARPMLPCSSSTPLLSAAHISAPKPPLPR